MSIETLTIERLGLRGEGVAVGIRGPVYVPYALPGETVAADVDGERGDIVDLTTPRPDRVAPVCPYFGACGGCAVQTLPAEPYLTWKRGLVVDVLRRAGVAAQVAPAIDAHGTGRRRATFHARTQPTPNIMAERRMRVGFMRTRSHEVIDVAECPVLAPSMAGTVPAVRAIAAAVVGLGKPLDIVVTATNSGLDVDLRGLGAVEEAVRQRLVRSAAGLDLARLSNHGEILVEQRTPFVEVGVARIVPPPGAFLQATVAGEEALVALVREAVGGARKIADLFCGLGTFSVRLAEQANVLAVDAEAAPVSALARAARETPVLRPVTTATRDLFRRPLTPTELAPFDAVVFDPPRAGAEAQVQALAQSKVPIVVAVSCNPATFARDASLLVAGGYQLEAVVPVDQFRYTAHVEMVGAFRRAKSRKVRSLFG